MKIFTVFVVTLVALVFLSDAQFSDDGGSSSVFDVDDGSDDGGDGLFDGLDSFTNEIEDAGDDADIDSDIDGDSDSDSIDMDEGVDNNLFDPSLNLESPLNINSDGGGGDIKDNSAEPSLNNNDDLLFDNILFDDSLIDDRILTLGSSESTYTGTSSINNKNPNLFDESSLFDEGFGTDSLIDDAQLEENGEGFSEDILEEGIEGTDTIPSPPSSTPTSSPSSSFSSYTSLPPPMNGIKYGYISPICPQKLYFKKLLFKLLKKVKYHQIGKTCGDKHKCPYDREYRYKKVDTIIIKLIYKGMKKLNLLEYRHESKISVLLTKLIGDLNRLKYYLLKSCRSAPLPQGAPAAAAAAGGGGGVGGVGGVGGAADGGGGAAPGGPVRNTLTPCAIAHIQAKILKKVIFLFGKAFGVHCIGCQYTPQYRIKYVLSAIKLLFSIEKYLPPIIIGGKIINTPQTIILHKAIAFLSKISKKLLILYQIQIKKENIFVRYIYKLLNILLKHESKELKKKQIKVICYDKEKEEKKMKKYEKNNIYDYGKKKYDGDYDEDYGKKKKYDDDYEEDDKKKKYDDDEYDYGKKKKYVEKYDGKKKKYENHNGHYYGKEKKLICHKYCDDNIQKDHIKIIRYILQIVKKSYRAACVVPYVVPDIPQNTPPQYY